MGGKLEMGEALQQATDSYLNVLLSYAGSKKLDDNAEGNADKQG